jgi:hypothetical protein
MPAYFSSRLPHITFSSAQGDKDDSHTRPVEFDFTLLHNVRTHAGILSRGDIHLGNAQAHLTGSYTERGEVTSIRIRLAGSGMPVPELVSLLPPLDIQLPAGSSLQGGTAGIDANIEGPLAALAGDASTTISNTKLTRFDLGAKLNVMETLAGIKASPDTMIEALSAKVHVSPAGQTIQDLKLVVPAIGNLDGAGTISGNHALDFKMRATVHTSGTLMNAIGQKGDTSVPFFIQGISENPSFRPDVKGMANEQVKKLETSAPVKKALDKLGGFLGGKK